MGTFWLQDASLLHKVREAILNAYGLQYVIPHRKVYASHSRAKIRRLVKKDLLCNLLSEVGFDIVYFANLLFQKQVKLVVEIVILMGAHGVKLINMLFMLSQGKFLELINGGNRNLASYKLSTYGNVEYYCLPCQSMGIVAINDSDISVDTHEFG